MTIDALRKCEKKEKSLELFYNQNRFQINLSGRVAVDDCIRDCIKGELTLRSNGGCCAELSLSRWGWRFSLKSGRKNKNRLKFVLIFCQQVSPWLLLGVVELLELVAE